MVQHVPHKILEVKQQQAGNQSSNQTQQARCFYGQKDGSPVPVENSHWEDVHQVVVEGKSQAALYCAPGDDVRLDLVAPDEGHSRREKVQDDEGQAEEQIDGQGEEYREEG